MFSVGSRDTLTRIYHTGCFTLNALSRSAGQGGWHEDLRCSYDVKDVLEKPVSQAGTPKQTTSTCASDRLTIICGLQISVKLVYLDVYKNGNFKNGSINVVVWL